MLYKRQDGSVGILPTSETLIAATGIEKLEEAVRLIDGYYEHLDTDMHAKLRSLAGRLMAMVEE